MTNILTRRHLQGRAELLKNTEEKLEGIERLAYLRHASR